jgi:RNA polymerase sigma-70 factor, ECF subfamily
LKTIKRCPSHRQSPPVVETDTTIILRCLQGDPIAWEALVRRYTGLVYSLCRRYNSRDCDAGDLTQDVFLRVFTRLHTFRRDEVPFASWLSLLTRNVVIDHYRHFRTEHRLTAGDDNLIRMEDPRGGAIRPDALCATAETCRFVETALAKLEPPLRIIIVLSDLQERPYHEVDHMLQIPIGTVKSRLSRARAVLSRHLARQKLAV